MRRTSRMTWGFFLCLVTLGCGVREDARVSTSPQDVSLLTQDGVRLAATLYLPAREGAPGLILVHDRLGSREHFAAFATKAKRDGYMSIAVDLRGHGGSATPNDTQRNPRSFTREDWMKCLADIDAAKRALVERGADPDNLAVAGAGLGANLALEYASRNEDIPAVVLLSPGLSYEGIETKEPLTRYGKRPVLLMTSVGDTYAATSCGTMHAAATGQCELHEYEGAAHGVDLLEAVEVCPGQILLWLRDIIGHGRIREESEGA